MAKVFGLGFSKTGTSSLEKALQALGYEVCRGHWKLPHTFFLHALYANKDYEGIRRLSEHFDAFADGPWGGTELYSYLYEWYPDAHFILTMREPEEWYRSLEKLLTMFDLNLKTCLKSYYAKGMFGSAYFFESAFAIDRLEGNRQKIIDIYNERNQEVLDFFATKPDAKFLVMRITEGDGWNVLCPFLDKPVPSRSFFHANKAEDNPYLSNTVKKQQD